MSRGTNNRFVNLSVEITVAIKLPSIEHEAFFGRFSNTNLYTTYVSIQGGRIVTRS